MTAKLHISGSNALLALCFWIQYIFAQTTVAPNFLGYAVEDASSITAASCDIPGMDVFSTSRFMYCEYSTAGWIRTACDGKNVLYSSGTSSMSAQCDDDCVPRTIIEKWPAGGNTWTMFDCMSMAGIDASVKTLYRASESERQTTTEAETTTKSPSTAQSEQLPTTTSNSDSEESDETSDGSANNGLGGAAIAGIVIGSFAGIGLIVGAIFLGIFIGRRKSQSGNPNELPVNPVVVSSSHSNASVGGEMKSGASTTQRAAARETPIEMDAVNQRYELSGQDVHEMDGVSTYNHV